MESVVELLESESYGPLAATAGGPGAAQSMPGPGFGASVSSGRQWVSARIVARQAPAGGPRQPSASGVPVDVRTGVLASPLYPPPPLPHCPVTAVVGRGTSTPELCASLLHPQLPPPPLPPPGFVH
jgi:hypothetical protein